MKINIVEEVIIPARFEIKFHEDREHEDFLVYDETGYDASLRDDITKWLDTHDPDWKIMFDRGDFGEGPAFVTISLSNEALAHAFFKTWNGDRCVAESLTMCPHNKRVDATKFHCSKCNRTFPIRRLL